MAASHFTKDRSDPSGRTYLYSVRFGFDEDWDERNRIEWLQEWLRLNAACPESYKVRSRDVIKMSTAQAAHQFEYVVSCP